MHEPSDSDEGLDRPRDITIHVVGPRWGPSHLLALDPGCAAFAATLGFVV